MRKMMEKCVLLLTVAMVPACAGEVGEQPQDPAVIIPASAETTQATGVAYWELTKVGDVHTAVGHNAAGAEVPEAQMAIDLTGARQTGEFTISTAAGGELKLRKDGTVVASTLAPSPFLKYLGGDVKAHTAQPGGNTQAIWGCSLALAALYWDCAAAGLELGANVIADVGCGISAAAALFC